MVNARGWRPLFFSGLSLLDDRLPMARRAQGSGLWKLKATTLAVGSKPLRLISILQRIQPLGDDHPLRCCRQISSQELCWRSQSYAALEMVGCFRSSLGFMLVPDCSRGNWQCRQLLQYRPSWYVGNSCTSFLLFACDVLCDVMNIHFEYTFFFICCLLFFTFLSTQYIHRRTLITTNLEDLTHKIQARNKSS